MKSRKAPDFMPDRCQGITKGGVRLGVPGRLARHHFAAASRGVRQHGNQREQPQQGRGRACDGLVGPLPLGLHAQVLTDFAVGHFNGLITNDKFCLSRTGRLTLSWSRRPLRCRVPADASPAYPPNDLVHCGGPHETQLARKPAPDPQPRRAAPMGSSLPTPSAVEPDRRNPAGGER